MYMAGQGSWTTGRVGLDHLAPIRLAFDELVQARAGHRLGFAAYHRGRRILLFDSGEPALVWGFHG